MVQLNENNEEAGHKVAMQVAAMRPVALDLTMEQGKGRFVMMDDSMWGMILGKSGKIPGTIHCGPQIPAAKRTGRPPTVWRKS